MPKSITGYIERIEKTIAIFRQINQKRTKKIEVQEEALIVNIKNDAIFSLLSETLSEVKYYHQVFAVAFEHMDTFGFTQTQSVDADYPSYGGENRFDMLRKINLYQHTSNVLRASIVQNSKRSDSEKALMVLIALLHDFGKSRLVKEYCIKNTTDSLNGMELTKHWHYSALYAKILLRRCGLGDDIVTQVSNVLQNHHTEVYARTAHNKDYLKILNEADFLARKWEEEALIELK